tara:strand:- start:104 stop:1075 length:972 start_codon:yes stop_codon:yes gene_type:complete
MSVATGVDGKLVWTLAAGYADIDSRTTASTATRYRVGSVAKSFTAVAMGTLLDDGALRLEDSYHQWVPGFPQKAHPFTLRQLASHQAGVRHYQPGIGALFETYHQTQYHTVSDALHMVRDDALMFEPGTAFLYSSYGYNMLSLALERAAETGFLQLMDQRVYEPLGMRSTQADHQGRETADVATPYLLWEDVILRQIDVNNSYKWAGGGFLSTPADLVRFANGLLFGDVISKNTRSLLWTPQLLSDGSTNPQNYALGFRVIATDRGPHISHGGSSVGGSAYMVMRPAEGIALGFATNATPLTMTRNLRQELDELLDLFLAARP